MEEQKIICPHCGKEIPLTEAIAHRIRAQLKAQFEEEARKQDEQIARRERSLQSREQDLEKEKESLGQTVADKVKEEKAKIELDLRKQMESDFSTKLRDLDNEVNEKEKKLQEAARIELELRAGQRELEQKAQAAEIELSRRLDEERHKLRAEFEATAKKQQEELSQREKTLSENQSKLEDARKGMDKELNGRLKLEREKLDKEAKEKAAASFALELRDLRAQVQEKDQRLQKAQDLELDLRKRERKLDEEKKAFELEMNRRLDAEKQTIRQEATKSLAEEYRLKDLDKDKHISDLTGQINELKRMVEQGSQERQGEVLEIELENILKANFQFDQIDPVPRGIRGADVLHKVHNNAGQYCGTIIWESKRTKAWSEAWVEKLKDNQREAKAEIAAIFTIALPEEVQAFGYHKGVWVTNYGSLVGVATALRLNLIQIAEINLAASGKHEKMEVLYSYLSGPVFRQKVEGIVEAFVAMQRDLDSEKRAMGRIWAKREKQIERVMNNTASFYGDMQGIIGRSLPEMKSLQLEAPTADEEPEVSG